MEKFVEKFNIFDLFTMLIPGMVITSLFGISLSFEFYDIWKKIGNEKYILFFIISYICGVFFQEIGTILDKFFLDDILYKGNPREIFLTEEKHNRIFKDELSYQNAKKIKMYLSQYIDFDSFKDIDEGKLNSLMFAYCLNISEMNGISGKAEKMIVISEMSRSLFLGCIVTVFINIVMICFFGKHLDIYLIESCILILMALVFLCRKKRYERYRIRNLIRLFLIYVQQEKNKI